MKGFYITVNNGLLDPKHYQGISEAIWLFMWCLDKMTIINHETGVGEVLGGKPIKFEDVEVDLGISRATYKRWLAILKKGKYISTNRTPYGLQIKVFKAKKRFGRKVINEPSRKAIVEPSESTKMSHLRYENEPSNKTQQLDTSVKDIAPQDGAREKHVALTSFKRADGKMVTPVGEVIEAFKNVNPKYQELFKMKAQHRATERMIIDHGFEKIFWVASQLSKTNKTPYAPIIVTPYELEKKLPKLIAYFQRKKAEAENKGIKINTL